MIVAYLAPNIDDMSRAKCERRFQAFAERVIVNSKGFRGVECGWSIEPEVQLKDSTRERGSVFLAVAGWESEDDWKAYRSSQNYKDKIALIDGMPGLTKLQMLPMVFTGVRGDASETEVAVGE